MTEEIQHRRRQWECYSCKDRRCIMAIDADTQNDILPSPPYIRYQICMYELTPDKLKKSPHWKEIEIDYILRLY
jgi:hypothetical protein